MPELNDSVAWMVAVGAGLVLFLCLVFLTRNLNWWWLRWVLRLVPAIALLLPVAVPDQPGFYAPAFVVGLFEQFLQADGRSAAAISRLIIILGSLVGLITLAAIARWARNRTAVSATSSTSAAEISARPELPDA